MKKFYDFDYSIVKGLDGHEYVRFKSEGDVNKYLEAIGRIEIPIYSANGYSNGLRLRDLLESLTYPQKLLSRPITEEDGA